MHTYAVDFIQRFLVFGIKLYLAYYCIMLAFLLRIGWHVLKLGGVICDVEPSGLSKPQLTNSWIINFPSNVIRELIARWRSQLMLTCFHVLNVVLCYCIIYYCITGFQRYNSGTGGTGEPRKGALDSRCKVIVASVEITCYLILPSIEGMEHLCIKKKIGFNPMVLSTVSVHQ